VEAQHRVATRKLVDSLEDQALLEQILDESKPPAREDTANLDYLLATPFRYPPLRHGSRFGARTERGIWYGAEEQRTVFAETAYYRLLFLDGTGADLGTLELALTVYRVPVAAARGLDLCAKAFEPYRRRLLSPADYRSTQALGRDLREHAVQALRFPSARDPDHGPCIGVLDPSAFAATRPTASQTWHCFATRERVEFLRGGTARTVFHGFSRATFLVDGALPAPAV
jgi:hypothetical protein